MHGHHPETHNYRPACARTGLAAPRRPSLVIQKIHRLAVGVANDWPGRPFWRGLPAMVERVEQAIKLAGSLTSNGPGSACPRLTLRRRRNQTLRRRSLIKRDADADRTHQRLATKLFGEPGIVPRGRCGICTPWKRHFLRIPSVVGGAPGEGARTYENSSGGFCFIFCFRSGRGRCGDYDNQIRDD
jgi:hypothetical protein